MNNGASWGINRAEFYSFLVSTFSGSRRPPPMERIRNYCVSYREARRRWLAGSEEREIPVETCSSALSVPSVHPLTSIASPHSPGDVVFVRDIPATGDQYRATRHRRDVVVRLLRCSRSTCSWRTVMRIVRDTPWHTFGVRFRGNSKSYNFYKVPQSYLYCIIIVKRSSV